MKQPYTVAPSDVHTLPPNSGRPGCPECKGSGTTDCHDCDGDGVTYCGDEDCNGDHLCPACDETGDEPCKACFGRGLGVADIKAAMAREATRLWQRDIGRGITTGKAETYVAFAAETYRETREAA